MAKFTCALCGGTFEKGWFEADARAEYEQIWKKEFRAQNTVVLCDPCYERMKAWKTPEQWQAEQKAKGRVD